MQPKELARIVGENVRRRRQELDLTQEALADKLGVTQSYLSEIENGKRSPLLGTLAEFSEVLEVDPAYLLTPSEVAV